MTPYVDPDEDRTPIEGRQYLPKWLEPAALDTKYVGPAAQSAALNLKQDVSTLDTAVTTKATTGGTALNTALNATFVPKWKPTTAYLAGDKVVNPGGDVVSAIANFTSGASYNAANWVLPTTYVRFVDLAGNPISARHVTIKVDTSTWEISDIVAEA